MSLLCFLFDHRTRLTMKNVGSPTVGFVGSQLSVHIHEECIRKGCPYHVTYWWPVGGLRKPEIEDSAEDRLRRAVAQAIQKLKMAEFELAGNTKPVVEIRHELMTALVQEEAFAYAAAEAKRSKAERMAIAAVTERGDLLYRAEPPVK